MNTQTPTINKEVIEKLDRLTGELDSHPDASYRDAFSSIVNEYSLSRLQIIAKNLGVDHVPLFIPYYPPSVVIEMLGLDRSKISPMGVVQFAKKFGLFEHPFKVLRIFRVSENENLSSSIVIFSILGVLDFFRYKKEVENTKTFFKNTYNKEDADYILDQAERSLSAT